MVFYEPSNGLVPRRRWRKLFVVFKVKFGIIKISLAEDDFNRKRVFDAHHINRGCDRFLDCRRSGTSSGVGFLDEMIFSSEWWARDEQRGEIGVFTLGTYGLEDLGTSYHFSLRQATEQGVVFAVNGSLGLDQLVVLNATSKYGTPDLYYGFGGMLWLADEQFLFLPRINLGGKFGPDLIKLVLDVDFYSLLIVNAGKLEMGTEFAPLTNLRLYGGLLRMFTGTLVTSKVLPGRYTRLPLDTKPNRFILAGKYILPVKWGRSYWGKRG